MKLKRCRFCSRVAAEDLCKRHSKIYIYDKDKNWFRFKKWVRKGVRKPEVRKFHRTETKLHEILKLIFGRDNVIASVHPTWAISPKGKLLEFDLAVPSINLLIEYNGLQHYEYPNFFHKTRTQFEEQVERDKIKKVQASQNGWDLLTIKYTEKISYGNIYELLKSMELIDV